METIKNLHLQSETARAIAKDYIKKYGETNIFDNADEVEKCIDLAIRRGATGRGIARDTVNYLFAANR